MTITNHTTVITFSEPPQITIDTTPDYNPVIEVEIDETLVLCGTPETLKELATAIIVHILMVERGAGQ